MAAFIVAFVVGVCVLQQSAELPSVTAWLGTTVPAGLAALLLAARKSALVGRRFAGSAPRLLAVVLVGAMLGHGWAVWRAQLRLSETLAPASEGRDIVITGVVADLPTLARPAAGVGQRFEFRVEQSEVPVPTKLRLSVYPEREGAFAPEVHAGERWRWTVRLKRPHGNLNPHGFDYEAYLLERGVRATGYVRAGAATRLEAAAPGFAYDLARMREGVRTRFFAALPQDDDTGTAAVLVALAIGDQSGIGPEQWERFARTGVQHLISVSGLHITMLAALAYAMTAWLWRALVRRSARAAGILVNWPLPLVAGGVGLLAALSYSLLAGFAVPAQRTVYMLATLAVAQAARRNIGFGPGLALALWVVVLIDPWAVLAPGFWLSFGAVTVLLLVGRNNAEQVESGLWMRTRKLVLGWLRAQWALGVAMLPVLLTLFGQISLIAPLANAVAIPVVSFAVTPLSLIAAASGSVITLDVAATLLRWLFAMLDVMAAWPFAVWQQAVPPLPLVGLAVLGVTVWLWPGRRRWRWLALLAILPPLFWQAPRPASGTAWIRVLDVGQGLAVHVQTARHDLLFDTGPAYSEDSDAGQRLVVPYLRAQGVQRLDALLLSHGDADHVGGSLSVLRALPAREIVHALDASTPLLERLPPELPKRSCRAGDSWDWDGVRFTVLHPEVDALAAAAPPTRRRRNAIACVLRVATDHGAALLPSDIEAPQESALAGRRPAEHLRAEVLVAPHHGSRTSSSDAFLAAVRPQAVIYPVGYRNRYGHPRPEVEQRYRTLAAQAWRSDQDGAVLVRLEADGVRYVTERGERARYWHGG